MSPLFWIFYAVCAVIILFVFIYLWKDGSRIFACVFTGATLVTLYLFMQVVYVLSHISEYQIKFGFGG